MKLLKALRMAAIIVIGVTALTLAMVMLMYPPDYIYRTIAWQQSDAFD